MEGGNVAFDVDDARHVVSLGLWKKHCTEAAKVVTLIDVGFSLVFFLALLMALNIYALIAWLCLFLPAVLTLLAVKNGNKYHALVPFVVSVIFIVIWTKAIIYWIIFVPDVYKEIKENIADSPIAAGVTSPFLRTLSIGAFAAAVELLIYVNLKLHYVLYRFLKEQEAAKKCPAQSIIAPAPAAYQGSYQGYDGQPPLVQNKVY